MNSAFKIGIVVLLALAVGVVVTVKIRSRPAVAPTALSGQSKPPTAALPKLVDLGAGKCIPCKAMAPILEELDRTYAGHFQVQFIDVWENRSAGEAYGIRTIPTQIFFDAQGKELFRHEGFFSREDILGTWKRLGHDFPKLAAAGPTKG